MSTTATSAAQEATTTVATPVTDTTITTETVVTNDGTETITTTTTTTEKTETVITEEQITESKEAEVKETEEVKKTEEVKETKEVKEAEEEEVKEISSGHLYKQRNTIIFNWGHKYFVFGDEKHSLAHLQIYHDKTLKPVKPGTTTESTEAPAVDEAELKESHKSLFSSIAHATVTGEGLLFYYKSDKNLSKPQGIINLAEVQDVIENKSIGKLHVFTIKTTIRDYHLQATSEKELKQWSKTILDKVENAKRVSAEVQTKDEYKECYEKLVQKKAFVSGKLPESELMSSDEDDSPREPKRRATLTTYLFSSFKKPEATTSEAKTETEETTEVLETKKVTIATTSDVVDGAATSTEKVESPKRGGSFSFFSRSKSPTAKPKEETKEDGDTKGETSKADGKEKAEEEIVVVETSTTVEPTEKKEEEKKESGNFLTKFLSGAKKTAKEEITTETEQTITEETTETTVVAKTDAVVEKDNTPEVSEEKEEKKETGNFLTKFLSGAKKTAKEEITTEAEQTITEETTIETTVVAKTDAVVEKDNTPEVSEDKEEKKEGSNFLTKLLSGPKKTAKEEITTTTEVTETKIEEVTETIENNVSDEVKPDSTVDIKRSQSVFKRISGKFMPTKRHMQDGSSDITHGREPSEAVASVSDIAVENTNATEAGGETQSNVETQLEREIKQKRAAAAYSGTLLKGSRLLKQYQPCEFFFEKEESTITYYSKTGPGKTIKITRDVKINKLENAKQFEIVTGSRTYRMEANKPEDCDEWVKVLNDFKDTITPVVDTKEEVEINGAEKKATETTEVAKMYDIAANSVTATTTEAVESSDIKEIISEKEEEIVTPKVEEIEAIKGSEEVKEEIEEKVEVKAEEAKVEVKVEEAKVEAKVEEAKVEEAKIEEAKIEEAKVEEAKVEEAKVEEVKETETVKETAKTPEKEASS